MSGFITSLLLSAGAGTWIYSKLYNRTGGINKTAIIGAVVSALVIFIVFYTLFNTFVPK